MRRSDAFILCVDKEELDVNYGKYFRSRDIQKNKSALREVSHSVNQPLIHDPPGHSGCKVRGVYTVPYIRSLIGSSQTNSKP